MLRIDDCDANVRNLDGDEFGGERLEHDDSHLYAIGAEVMLTADMWTKAGFVNGACSKIGGMIVIQGDCKAHVFVVNLPSYISPALSPKSLLSFPLVHTD